MSRPVFTTRNANAPQRRSKLAVTNVFSHAATMKHCAGPLRKRPNTKEKGTDGFGGMKPAERSSVSFSYACLCSCSKTPSEKSARTIFISSGTKAGINSFVSLMSYVITRV